MTAILTNEGQLDQLDTVLTAKSANLRVGLYTARSVYSKSSVLASVTACTFSGYAAQTPGFSSTGVDGAGRIVYAAASLTFTHNGGGTGNTVLGYYVYDTSTGKLQFLEDFSAPISMTSNGQTITVSPVWYYGDLTAPL